MTLVDSFSYRKLSVNGLRLFLLGQVGLGLHGHHRLRYNDGLEPLHKVIRPLAMKLIHCPINGPRPLAEFAYGGEVRTVPDANVDDAAWADYVFNRAGEPGVRREWWYHVASGTWFIAERDNLNDEFLRTYLYGEPGADR